jgi:hypothetical protein
VGAATNFFVLHPVVGSPFESTYERASGSALGEAQRCPRCGLYVGMKRWLAPHRVELEFHGEGPGDVCFNGVSDLVVSETFRKAWTGCGLSGLAEFDPAFVMHVSPESVTDRIAAYFHVEVRRFGSTIDWAHAAVVAHGSAECELCGGARIVDAYARLHLRDDSWTGEDIFTPWGVSGLVVVTESVVKLAADFELKNLTTTPLGEYRWDPLRRLEPSAGSKS